MGFEPTTSTLTGWRALRAAPRGHSCPPTIAPAMAQEGFEPSASRSLNASGLPVAYRAGFASGSQGGARPHNRPGSSRAARPIGVPGLLVSRSDPGAGIEPAASTFRAWRHYQQQLPRSRPSGFGKEDSNLHGLIQNQGAFRLADSRERPAGVEPACRAWEARAWPLGQGRRLSSAGSGIRTPVARLKAGSRAAGPIPRSSRRSPIPATDSGRRGSRTPKAHRSPDFESGAVANRLVLPPISEAPAGGFEPPIVALTGRRLTVRPRRSRRRPGRDGRIRTGDLLLPKQAE
jgi:hypothetical protein